MTDITLKFDPIPRLQQIAATIEESGAIADIFDSPATAAYDIECAIKEIERLHRDYSCICGQMRRMMEERDEARRRLCLEWMEHGPVRLSKEQIAMRYGWDCFKENHDD
jgi:glutamine phosphoribosylpyrophosphate amidotransferase